MSSVLVFSGLPVTNSYMVTPSAQMSTFSSIDWMSLGWIFPDIIISAGGSLHSWKGIAGDSRQSVIKIYIKKCMEQKVWFKTLFRVKYTQIFTVQKRAPMRHCSQRGGRSAAAEWRTVHSDPIDRNCLIIGIFRTNNVFVYARVVDCSPGWDIICDLSCELRSIKAYDTAQFWYIICDLRWV